MATYIGQAVRVSTDFDTWAKPNVDLAEGSGYLDAAASKDRIVAVGYAGDDLDIPISLFWDGSTWSGSSIDDGAAAPLLSRWPGEAANSSQSAPRSPATDSTRSVGPPPTAWPGPPGLMSTTCRGPDPGTAAGDDPFQHRTIGGGDPGFVVAQTLADGLHVWFATAGTF